MRHHQPARPSDRTGRRELPELGEEAPRTSLSKRSRPRTMFPATERLGGERQDVTDRGQQANQRVFPTTAPIPRGREREKENDGDDESDQENQSPDNDRDDRRARLGRAGSRRDGTRDLANGRREIGAPRRWWLSAETEGKMRLHVPRVAGQYEVAEANPLYRQ